MENGNFLRIQPPISNIQSPNRLPGFLRAGPSTPLDKSVQIIRLLGLIVAYLRSFVKLGQVQGVISNTVAINDSLDALIKRSATTVSIWPFS